MLVALCVGRVAAAETKLDLGAVDAALAKIAPHAQSFPPTFSSAAQRKQVEAELQALIKKLDAAVLQSPDRPDLLFRDGYANALGHNLDLPDCGEQFIKSFEAFLKIKPDDRQGNYLYGGFLAGTALREKSIPYLEKAIRLGETDAHYTLAFTYLTLGDKTNALHHLRAYGKLHPDEATAINARIEELSTAKIDIHSNPPPWLIPPAKK